MLWFFAWFYLLSIWALIELVAQANRYPYEQESRPFRGGHPCSDDRWC